MNRKFSRVKLGSNFVCWHIDYLCIALNHTVDHNKIIDDEYKFIIEHISNKRFLIISNLWEASDPTSWKKSIEKLTLKIKKYAPDLTIIQLANSWYQDFNLLVSGADAIYYLDFFLLRVYYKILIEKLASPATQWNSNSTKFLFLTGKASKFNRIRLLYKLKNNCKLANNMTWSLSFKNLADVASSKVYITELSNNEYNDFVQQNINFPDEYFSHTGIPYGPQLYENKLFNLVSETDFDRPLLHGPWITEKTWLSIVNRLPFIIAGERKTLNRLTEMKFKTFQEYLLIPNYDDPDSPNFLQYQTNLTQQSFFQNNETKIQWKIFYQLVREQSWPNTLKFFEISSLPKEWQDKINNLYRPGIQYEGELRLDAIVQNSEFWLKNIKKFHKKIYNDIETNYCRFIELGEINLNQVRNIETRYLLQGDILPLIFY